MYSANVMELYRNLVFKKLPEGIEPNHRLVYKTSA
jgi:hypothetical protein